MFIPGMPVGVEDTLPADIQAPDMTGEYLSQCPICHQLVSFGNNPGVFVITY